MRQLFAVLFVLMLYPSLFAQGFVPGLLVLESGDSIAGEIYYRSKDGLKDRIVLKNEKGERQYFKMDELKEIHADSNTYIKAKPEKDVVFLRLLSKGALNLYEYEYLRDYQGVYTLSFELFVLPEGSGVFEPIPTNPKAWRNTLVVLMQDAPDLVQKIEDKQFGPEDSPRLFELYNAKKKSP